MTEDEFLSTLPRLNGKVAVVTGGTSGMGLCTALNLALLGARVHICAPRNAASAAGFAEAKRRLEERAGSRAGSPAAADDDDEEEEEEKEEEEVVGELAFHQLDLSTVRGSRESVARLTAKLRGRCDVVVANAAVCSSREKVTEEGWEENFAVNCLGHWVFVGGLLDAIKATANEHGEARIVVVGSNGYKIVSKFDYEACTSGVPHEGKWMLGIMFTAWYRYLNSKLGTLYFTMELNRRLKEEGVENVFVNTLHPGNAAKTDLGVRGNSFLSEAGSRLFKAFCFLGYSLSYTTEDAAKTQTYVAASRQIADERITGKFWMPQVSLRPTPWNWMRYTGCNPAEVTKVGTDEKEWKKFWEYCEDCVRKVDESFSGL